MAKLSKAIADELFRKRGIILIAMALGFIAAVLHATLLPEFEIIAFLSFLGPLGLGAYGIRTYREVKEKEYAPEREEMAKYDPLLG